MLVARGWLLLTATLLHVVSVPHLLGDGAAAAQAPGAPVPGQPIPGATAAPTRPPGLPARDRRPDENARGTATIRGVVVAADSGAPVRRATVRAFEQRGNGGGLAQTDAQGRFEIATLPAGRYVVSVSRSGYVNLQFGQKAPNTPGTPLEVADGQTVDRVNFSLPRGGAISGRIVDDLGEPVSSAQVVVQRFAYVGGSRRLVGASSDGGFDRTDDLGQFRLFGLPPGEYYVSASLRSAEFMTMSPQTSSGPTEGFAPTYYPGTTSAAEARRVTLRVGQDLANISFALVSARLGRVSGRVVTSSGAPFTGMMMVSPRGDESSAGPFGTTGIQVRGDGSFQTGGLAPGNYSLIVQPRDLQDTGAEVARLDVRVDGNDLQDVLVATGRGGIVRGRIVSDDGTVLPFRPGQVRVLGLQRDPRQFMGGMRPNAVRDDWTFELSGLVDAIRLGVSIEARGGWSMRHAWKDGVDLADTVVNASPGESIDGVEIVLTQKSTELSGQLTDGRSGPVNDASVVVFPEDKQRWAFGSRYLRVGRPDPNGKYTLRLIPGRDYRVVVVRGLEDGQFADPEFLSQALQHATPFDIGEGEAKVMDLKVVEIR